MAKLVAYKMVSPTVTKSVKGALKTSVHSNLDAINNLGKSVNSLSGLTSDLVKISKAFEKTSIEQAIAKRRKVRRKKDSAAEDRQEGKRQGAAEKESSNIVTVCANLHKPFAHITVSPHTAMCIGVRYI